MSNLTVLPLGICHANWQSTFYPDDLPDCWRLSYFANEFSACCLTVADIELFATEVEDFAEDLPDDFRCYLYLESGQLPKLKETFIKRVTGILVERGLSQNDVSMIRQSYGQSVKLYSLDSNRLPLCHTFGVYAQLHCYVVSASEASDLRRLKSEVVKWLENSHEETLILVECGTDIVLLNNVTKLVSLLAQKNSISHTR